MSTPMMAMTTSSSISVKPIRQRRRRERRSGMGEAPGEKKDKVEAILLGSLVDGLLGGYRFQLAHPEATPSDTRDQRFSPASSRAGVNIPKVGGWLTRTKPIFPRRTPVGPRLRLQRMRLLPRRQVTT